jgi:hypothetical protein
MGLSADHLERRAIFRSDAAVMASVLNLRTVVEALLTGTSEYVAELVDGEGAQEKE